MQLSCACFESVKYLNSEQNTLGMKGDIAFKRDQTAFRLAIFFSFSLFRHLIQVR